MHHVFKCAPISLDNVCYCVCTVSVKSSFLIADALECGHCSRITLCCHRSLGLGLAMLWFLVLKLDTFDIVGWISQFKDDCCI